MAWFSSSRQKKLQKAAFVPTRTLFEAPAFSFLPSFYADDTSQTWAAVFPAAEATVHSFAAIIDCEVVENEELDVLEHMDKKELLRAVIANPTAVSKANASRGGKYCTKLNLALSIQDPGGKPARIEVPFLTQELPRKSKSYALLRKHADALCEAFLHMRDTASGAAV